MYQVNINLFTEDSDRHIFTERKTITMPFVPMVGMCLCFKTGNYDSCKIDEVQYIVEDQKFEISAVLI